MKTRHPNLPIKVILTASELNLVVHSLMLHSMRMEEIAAEPQQTNDSRERFQKRAKEFHALGTKLSKVS